MESRGIAKTRLLSERELMNLRERVQKRFLSREPSRSPILSNTFLGSYDGLREDILQVVPGAELSVSPTRLRKLFHYTNPEVCSEEHLERASFGKDFLEILERYVVVAEEMPKPKGVQRQNFRKRWGVLGVLMVATLLATAPLIFSPNSKPWLEDFKSLDVDSLKDRGWEIRHFDSKWFSRQLRDGKMLTLWTLPGDYWVKEGEPRQITNMLVRRVEGDCFSVTMKICDFHPSQVSQQIALFLFDEHQNPKNWVRLGFEYLPSSNRGIYQITKTHSLDGEIVALGAMHAEQVSDTSTNRTQNIWLKISVVDKIYQPSHKIAYDWMPIVPSDIAVPINFKPSFVGIGAYQGWTLDDGTPKGADTIPAFVEHLIFEPCNQ